MTQTSTGSSAPSGTTERGAAPQPRLYRSSTDRYVAGVCGGIGAHLGVSSTLVRVVFAFAVVAGPGLPVYGFLWVMTKSDRSAPGMTEQLSQAPRRALHRNQILVVVGVLALIVGLGWGGPLSALGGHLSYVIPVVAVAAGAFLAWSQLDDTERGRWRGRSPRGKVLSIARPVIGFALTLVGVIALATQGQGLDVVASSAVAAFAVLIGAAVIAAPWMVRLWQGLQHEQTERIRATERADIAAHLHDSVLQTLALIQRRADDPATVVRLARSQERELRAWLYADQERSADSLATAVAAVAHEVEDDHGVPIEVVVTGDRPLDPGGAALVKAAREAMLNAVRHGEPPVSTFVEIGRQGVECFIRDHGAGFDLSEMGDDRLGVRESILGRMARHGGAAKIRRLEHGTEIALILPPLPGGQPEPEAATRPETAPDPASRPTAPQAPEGAHE
ncbi:MAG: PspC domain-containing protein [Lapillicoccus sp.]